MCRNNKNEPITIRTEKKKKRELHSLRVYIYPERERSWGENEGGQKLEWKNMKNLHWYYLRTWQRPKNNFWTTYLLLKSTR